MISKPLGVLPIFAASRVVLFAISLFAVLHLPINAIEAQGFHLPSQPNPLLEAWARYDACWYVAIAEGGYREPIGPWGDMRAGFFPLFPALVTALTTVVRVPLLAGLIVPRVVFGFLSCSGISCIDWPPRVHAPTVWIIWFPSAFSVRGLQRIGPARACTGALARALAALVPADCRPPSPRCTRRWGSSSSRPCGGTGRCATSRYRERTAGSFTARPMLAPIALAVQHCCSPT